MKVFRILALSLLIGGFGTLIFSFQPASALSGSQFQAGRIMDDSVFFNANGMNANDIQAFLNSKVPTCDTNGTKPYGGTTRAAYGTSKGYPPPYKCLKSYVQSTSSLPAEPGLCNGFSGGTKSAAQIINEVAVSCGINQRVLLVLLQKEQSFITDDWPWSVQYQKATGYACPDTAPCDPEFAGFFKQVYYGARQFKRYAQTPDSWRYKAGRTNAIQWHPNAGCGSSNVFIQNQATAGLYIFTPYRPNTAALNNLYGTGDGCSSYGNRNFWRMYNDWFGPTLGPLIRSLNNSTLYYSDGTSKYIVPSMNIAAQYGLGLQDVRYMHQQEVDAIPLTNSPNTKNLSQLVKSDSDSDADGGALYLVSGSKKYQVQSMGQLSSFGFSSSQISYMALHNLHRLQVGGSLQNFVQVNSFIYSIENGKKRGVFSLATYNSLNPGGKYTKLSTYTAGTVPTGDPRITGDAVMRRTDGKMWLFQDNTWHYVPTMGIHSCWNLPSLPNYNFDANKATAPSSSAALSCVAERSNGQKFILNKTNRFASNPSWGIGNITTTVADRTIDRLPQRSAFGDNTAFKPNGSSTIYVLEGGKKRGIVNYNNYQRLGFNSTNTANVDGGFLSTLANGPVKAGTGTILKKSDGTLYAINGNNKLYIPNMNVYNAFNFSKSTQLKADAALLNSYSDQGSLSTRFWISSQALLTDSGKRYNIPDSLKAHAGYTSPGSPSYGLWMTGNTSGGKDLTRFIKASNSSTIYYLENGQKRPIETYQKFTDLGGNQSNITTLSSYSLSLFPNGSAI